MAITVLFYFDDGRKRLPIKMFFIGFIEQKINISKIPGRTISFVVISGEIGVNYFAQIRVMLEIKFRDNALPRLTSLRKNQVWRSISMSKEDHDKGRA